MRQVVSEVDPGSLPVLNELINDDPFRLTQREFDAFWDSNIARAMVEDVRNQWQNRGLVFPVDSDEPNR